MSDLDRLARNLDDVGDALGVEVDKLIRASTLRCEALGKAGANVRTGAMKNSITSEFEGGPGSDRIVGETGPTVSYAQYPHDGTSRIAPNPFMFRAADVVEPEFFSAAEALGGRVLDG